MSGLTGFPIMGNHPHPLIFASVCGSRMYGFHRENSDFDVHGAHILPMDLVIGLDKGPQTVRWKASGPDGTRTDVQTQDIEKHFQLILRRNGNALEQLFSPHPVRTTPEHQELMEIARGCVTKGHFGHYAGMANQMTMRIEKEGGPTTKTALHLYRTLLTGARLMERGEVETHLPTMAREAGLPFVEELIARRRERGDEKLGPGDRARCGRDARSLTAGLEEARDRSKPAPGTRRKKRTERHAAPPENGNSGPSPNGMSAPETAGSQAGERPRQIRKGGSRVESERRIWQGKPGQPSPQLPGPPGRRS